MAINIRTNGHVRLLDDDYDHDGFVYRGQRYSLSDFESTNHSGFVGLPWDGFHMLTYWHGIVVRIVDCDSVVVGHYFVD